MPQVSIENLISAGKKGEIISFPTDTVPALAVLPEKANLIFTLKERNENKPLILMGGYLEQLWDYVKGTPAELKIWQQVAEKYLPGALTLVLPGSDRVPRAMNPQDSTTIGIRVPDHSIACKILSQTGPLATTSANKSGQPALLSMGEIDQQFPEIFTLKLEQEINSNLSSGMPSTVIKWMDNKWLILRQGAVKITAD
ncbi:MAG TPA: L-threonylcarbamoyladenylate synthase [Allocoleopsis sp.]